MNPWKNLATLSPQEIRDLQNRKLRDYITNYIYPFSPYYRKLFDDNGIKPEHIKTVKDLSLIPTTSKLDFIDQDDSTQKFQDFILQPDKEKIQQFWPLNKKIPLLINKITKGEEAASFALLKEFRPSFITYTTGTTNKPTPFMYTGYDFQNLEVSGSRMLNIFGIKSEDKTINMFPYAPHLAFWQAVMGGLASCLLILSTGGGKTIGTEGNIKALVKMQPAVLIGVPSYIYHVLRVAKDEGCKMPFLKKIILGASSVTVGFKMKLAELIRSMGGDEVSVFGTYGFTEARCAWGECPTDISESSGYHLYPDKEVFEIVDPQTGEVKGEGEDGEIVYTGLDARGSCVLRYRTGDLVKGGIRYDKCSHMNWYIPRLSSQISRLSDVKDLQLSKIKGALVNLTHFGEILENNEEVQEWQIELRKKNDDPYEVDELVLYLCSTENCNAEALKSDVKREMVAATEVSPNHIEMISMEEMVKRLELEISNKEKRVLDKRPKV